MGKKHTMYELKQMQSLPLEIKIKMTERRVEEWIKEFGEDGVYISFSGGKDSTVLLDIVRNRMGYENIPAVFVDTGLEYPEIREFVKSFGDSVTWLKPHMNFKEVLRRYGFPFVNKEVAHKIHDWHSMHDKGKMSYVDRQFDGSYVSKNGKTNMISVAKWKFLTEADFRVSHKCCDVMKKKPTKEYNKQTGRVPITAQMAQESKLRMQRWLVNGCNAFEKGNPMSNPMSFWTEQDVLQYIKAFDLPICSVYGEVVYEIGGGCKDQLSFADCGIGEETRKLKTTGCDRTGCIFCGFGCHLEKAGNGRFEKLKHTHPQLYDYVMKPESEGGLGYKEKFDWINEHNGKGTIIRY